MFKSIIDIINATDCQCDCDKYGNCDCDSQLLRDNQNWSTSNANGRGIYGGNESDKLEPPLES